MALIKHSPEPSLYPLVKLIEGQLFEAEDRRIERSIDSIIADNAEAYGERLGGFHYCGRFFRLSGLVGKVKRKILHPSLHDKMDCYLADEATVTTEKQSIRQSLVRLLDPCTSDQDIRDTLPECLSSMVDRIAGLSRTRAEAFTIRDDDRAYRQYLQVLPLIQTYAVARMLY